MFTPRAVFSCLFLEICPFVLSLYNLGRLVTLSCEINDQSPITCVNSHYIESVGRVWSVYIHKVNPKMRLKDMAMWIYKMAAGYNRKWRSTVPENPTLETNTKSIRRRIAEIWPFEVLQNGRRPPSWIWSNRKWRRSICRPRKPTLEPNMKGIGWRVTEIWPFEVFQSVWMGLRSVVPSSVVNYTSYTDLIYSSFATLGT